MTNRFADELLTWGPDAPRPLVSDDDAQRYCRRLARSHYENFVVGSCLLPRRIRQHFFNVYAYCRWSDDLADEVADSDESLRLLDWWEAELKSPESRHPVMQALQRTRAEFEIPLEPFVNLLRAFRQDQRQSRYADWAELLNYCRNSANPVGHLVLHLGGVYNDENATDSDSICTGLQLANFWQDMARDYSAGRIYAPQELCAAHGVAESDFGAPRAADALRKLSRELVERTAPYFEPAAQLAARAPRWLAADIRLFANGGLSTLEAIRRQGYDVLCKRPTVSRRRQMWLLTTAWFAGLRGAP